MEGHLPRRHRGRNRLRSMSTLWEPKQTLRMNEQQPATSTALTFSTTIAITISITTAFAP